MNTINNLVGDSNRFVPGSKGDARICQLRKAIGTATPG